MEKKVTRKPRTDSVAGAIHAAIVASMPIASWPDCIEKPEGIEPFWDSIIKSKAAEEWSDNDYILAAQLAKSQMDIQAIEKQVSEEGLIVTKKNGDPMINPKQIALEQLAKRQLSLMRSLQITGSASAYRKQDMMKQRQLERRARIAATNLSEDELLA